MQKFLSKIIARNKEAFNGKMFDIKKAMITKDQATIDRTTITQEFLGTLGSWLENEELSKKCHIIYEQTEIYEILITNSLENPLDIAKAILYLIKRNLETGILDEQAVFTNFEFMRTGEIMANQDLIHNCMKSDSYYDSYMVILNETLKRNANPDEHEYRRISVDENEDISKFIQSHKIIKEHLFAKRKTFNEEDINETINALAAIGFSNEILKNVKDYLEIEFTANKKREAAKEEKPIIIKRKEPVKINYKEYKIVYKEIEKFYNLKTNQLLGPIELKDIFYVITLMNKVNMSSKAIESLLNQACKYKVTDEFLSISDFKNIITKLIELNAPIDAIENFIFNVAKLNKLTTSMHPIALYSALYEKIKDTKETGDIASLMEDIETCIGDSFICNDEDYAVIKDFLIELMNKLMPLLPVDGEYEKRLLKKF